MHVYKLLWLMHLAQAVSRTNRLDYKIVSIGWYDYGGSSSIANKEHASLFFWRCGSVEELQSGVVNHT